MSKKKLSPGQQVSLVDRRVRRHLKDVVRHGATIEDFENNNQDWQEPLPINKREKKNEQRK